MIKRIAALFMIAFGVTVCHGDQLKFKGAGSLECTVLQQGKDKITVLYENGLLTFNRADIADVKQDEPPKQTSATVKPPMPDWRTLVVHAAAQSWADGLEQIPATVIDVGVLRNIPYKSHRCGKNYEINVYGDPELPAGFEIGIFGELLDSPEAKKRCIEFVCTLLGDKTDADVVRLLDMKSDSITRKGLTFEITPPTAEDAYGGWWISVYDEKALNGVRASEEELKAITVAKAAAAAIPAPERKKSPASSSPTRETTPSAKRDEPTPAPDSDVTGWKPVDMGRARSQPPSSSGSGRVYVRGYYRKDGTYVRGHSRRK